MLHLISEGPSGLVINTEQVEEMLGWLQANLGAIPLEQLNFDTDRYGNVTTLFLKKPNQTDEVQSLSLDLFPVDILSGLSDAGKMELVQSFRALPRTIYFNGLGNIQAVIAKMQTEFRCQKKSMTEILSDKRAAGVMIVFLEDHGIGKRRTYYPDVLYLENHYIPLLNYLRIHAPRYLAKAFSSDAWHMVDIRIFDRYEAYELQYNRLLKLIRSLNLGYIVTETWNREVPRFSDPIGMYQIRLLTFLDVKILKTHLIALEYSLSGERIVDLDLYYHNNKISWNALMDDKEIRKAVKASNSSFPRSQFFAYQNDKNAIITYSREMTKAKLNEGDIRILRAMEEEIEKNALDTKNK